VYYSKKLNEVANVILAQTDPLDGRRIPEKIYKRDEIYWTKPRRSARLTRFLRWIRSQIMEPQRENYHKIPTGGVDVTKPLIESGGHDWFFAMNDIFFAKGPSIKGGAILEGASMPS